MEKIKRVNDLVSRIGELPAMPKVVTQIIDLTEKNNVSVSEISELIEQDLGLTGKILKVSNSPYYGMRQVVGTLKLALVILGFKEVRNIVLSISIMDTLNNSTTNYSYEMENIRAHSALVAAYSKKLSTYLDLSLQGEEFIAGLLHDIGKLVLWQKIQAEYEDIHSAAQEQNISLHELEDQALGFDHADVAYALAVKWGLPSSLSDALLAHHSRSDRRLFDMENPKLCAIVRIANLAVREDFLTETADPEALLSCADDEAWTILSESASLGTKQERFELLSQISSKMEYAEPLLF